MWQKEINHKKAEFEEIIQGLGSELAKIHTGRASDALVADLNIVYYGIKTPLKKLAQIAIPQSNLIVITPWDKGAVKDIEKTLRDSGLGVGIVSDGQSLKLTLPPLSEERRLEMVKLIRKKGEEAKIKLRLIREEIWGQIQKMEKEKKITEDDKYQAEKELNKLISEMNQRTAQKISDKEKEIMKV